MALQQALLDETEARARACAVRLVLTDCDGVLTDGGVYYSATGDQLKRFSVRDGMGVRRLQHAGIETGIVSGDDSATIIRRAERLGLQHVYLGIEDKAALLQDVLKAHDFNMAQVAYIGDDWNDLGIIAAVGAHGLTAGPADAMPAVAEGVHYLCRTVGGAGAFREFVEWILALRSA